MLLLKLCHLVFPTGSARSEKVKLQLFIKGPKMGYLSVINMIDVASQIQ